MTAVWYQAEFYSELGKCWVPLFSRHETAAAAQEYMQLIVRGRRRVVKVTQTKEEVIGDSR